MVFSSATFLFVFLPLTLAAYYLVPRRGRNAVLLAASLLFYAFGEPVYVLLLLFSSLSGWLHSLYIETHRGSRGAKIALASSIILHMGLLGFFKYADFFLSTLNTLFRLSLPLTGVALPIGISFFTFQTMSYTIDVFRGQVHAQRNFATLATFVCLFPQLIAGPIVRYGDIAQALDNRRETWLEMERGVRRFTLGLAKKVLLANPMGELATACLSESTALACWLYAAAFALQIYFDFSGYSDMAIGLGRMFGFHFPENFDYPYLSQSVTEFWRRWHMTLGAWFRDYVYIPLGGNRTSRAKWLRNLAVVWLLTGLWHGAAWNFVLWGALFGLLLMAEKLWLGRILARLPRFLRHIYLLFLVAVSFVLFNAGNLSDAWRVISGFFGTGGLWGPESRYLLRSYAVLLAMCCLGATPLPRRLGRRLNSRRSALVLEPAWVAALLALSTAALVDGSFNPFLYFRF